MGYPVGPVVSGPSHDVACPHCEGIGMYIARGTATATRCYTCDGSGMVDETYAAEIGDRPRCPYSECDGSGRTDIPDDGRWHTCRCRFDADASPAAAGVGEGQ